MTQNSPADLTIADVVDRGDRIGIVCPDCGRFRYFTPKFPQTAKLAEIAKEIRCFRCHSQAAELRIISRDAKTGRWPAEGG